MKVYPIDDELLMSLSQNYFENPCQNWDFYRQKKPRLTLWQYLNKNYRLKLCLLDDEIPVWVLFHKKQVCRLVPVFQKHVAIVEDEFPEFKTHLCSVNARVTPMTSSLLIWEDNQYFVFSEGLNGVNLKHLRVVLNEPTALFILKNQGLCSDNPRVFPHLSGEDVVWCASDHNQTKAYLPALIEKEVDTLAQEQSLISSKPILIDILGKSYKAQISLDKKFYLFPVD